jgi:hypothetical protein
VYPRDDPGGAVILVQGDLLISDIDAFRTRTTPYSKGLVVFQSDGGYALAGIEIGDLIRLRNFATWVPSGNQCSSACAVAWLGGAHRFMGRKALIGFHAAYRIDQGKPVESGRANAVLGAYLSQLGLSYRAIIYITSSPPSSMRWLSLSDAQSLGIDVTVFDLENR